MQGEFGPVVGAPWNFYVLGLYTGLQWAWIILLGGIAIRRIQRIPIWSSILTMLAAFAISMFLSSVFVRCNAALCEPVSTRAVCPRTWGDHA